jgi:hypothetical protein
MPDRAFSVKESARFRPAISPHERSGLAAERRKLERLFRPASLEEELLCVEELERLLTAGPRTERTQARPITFLFARHSWRERSQSSRGSGIGIQARAETSG